MLATYLSDTCSDPQFLLIVKDSLTIIHTTLSGFHARSMIIAVHNYCSENRYLLSDLVGMYKEKFGTEMDVLR